MINLFFSNTDIGIIVNLNTTIIIIIIVLKKCAMVICLSISNDNNCKFIMPQNYCFVKSIIRKEIQNCFSIIKCISDVII